MNRYLVGTCAYNEGEKIQRVLGKFNRYDWYDVLVVNDGSTDGSLDRVPGNVTVITNPETRGAGYGVRSILRHAKDRGYTAVFFVSGNDKDSPDDVARLKEAIEEGYDFVQGSRYLPGGNTGGMPAYRTVSTRFIHPALFSLITRSRITDSTNGFRAIRCSILDDARIDINQPWLDRYELEPYLFYKALRCGYRVKEVPVIKIYPPKKIGYTKMKPFSGWWSILRPLVYLGLGIKR